jgi:hypothetical protein
MGQKVVCEGTRRLRRSASVAVKRSVASKKRSVAVKRSLASGRLLLALAVHLIIRRRRVGVDQASPAHVLRLHDDLKDGGCRRLEDAASFPGVAAPASNEASNKKFAGTRSTDGVRGHRLHFLAIGADGRAAEQAGNADGGATGAAGLGRGPFRRILLKFAVRVRLDEHLARPLQ